MVEHPDGSLFVATYGDPPRPTLWKSSDGGASWKRVDVGTEEQGATGNSDSRLTSDGHLHSCDASTCGATAGHSIKRPTAGRFDADRQDRISQSAFKNKLIIARAARILFDSLIRDLFTSSRLPG